MSPLHFTIFRLLFSISFPSLNKILILGKGANVPSQYLSSLSVSPFYSPHGVPLPETETTHPSRHGILPDTPATYITLLHGTIHTPGMDNLATFVTLHGMIHMPEMGNHNKPNKTFLAHPRTFTEPPICVCSTQKLGSRAYPCNELLEQKLDFVAIKFKLQHYFYIHQTEMTANCCKTKNVHLRTGGKWGLKWDYKIGRWGIKAN